MTRSLTHWIRFLTLLLPIMLVGGVISCQRDSNPRTIVRLSGWQSNPTEKQLLDRLLKRFEAAHPEIQVKLEVITSEYMDVIKTRLIGDVGPDVFYLDAFEAPSLMKYKVLEPLDSYIQKSFHLNDFEPSLLNAFRYQGHQYGIPKDFSSLALLYNRQAFQEAKIAAPPKTWDEFLTMSQRLMRDRNRDGQPDQYGYGLTADLARHFFMLRSFGGQLVNAQGLATFAEPAGLRALQPVVQQYQRDRSSAQPTDLGASNSSELFGQGRVAMVIEGPWALPYLKETFPKLQFATAEIPTINGKPGTMAFTVGYVMNRQSRKKAAAWKLIEYLTNSSGMKAWTSQGLALPSRRSLLREMGYDRHPIYRAFANGARYATIWQAGETLPTVRTHFNNQFSSILLGEQPLDSAMKKAQEAANREIQLAN